MPVAMEMLAEKTGLNLKASPVFVNEIVLARLKDAPVQVALDHMAEAFLAKWRIDPDGTRWLVRDDVAQRKHNAVKRADDMRTIAGSLEYLARRLGEQPAELDAKAIEAYKSKLAIEEAARKKAEETQDYSRMFTSSSAAEETPAWRCLARLIPLISVQTLTDLPNDSRDVWTQTPTRMQHLLPRGADAIIDQYRREHLLLDPNQQIARVKLIFKKWEHGAAFNVSLQADDKSGAPIDKAFGRMNNDSDRLKQPYAPKEYPSQPGEKPLEVSTDALEMRQLINIERTQPIRPDLLAKWRPKLLDPMKFEPTQYFQAASYLAAAEALDKNMIGTVSDLLSTDSRRATAKTPSQYLAASQSEMLPTNDGWIVLQPSEDIDRNERRAGQRLLVDSVQRGGVTVDAASVWAGQSTDRWPFINWLGDYLQVLHTGGGPYSSLSTTMDDLGLRLWDSLGGNVRARLKGGETIQLSGLTAPALAKIDRLVYWFEALDEAKGDPTDVMPNGVAGGKVSLTIEEKPIFIGWTGAEPASPRPIDAASFGKYQVSGNTWWEEPASVYLGWNRFRMGISRTYNLKFVLEPGNALMTSALVENLFDPQGKVLTKLPDKVEAEVEKARQAEKSKPKVVPPPEIGKV